MDNFAGLDVSVKETSVCIVDDTSRIVQEVKVASEPDALLLVHALRSGPDPAGTLNTMVLAEGLGDADRQASRDEKGDRGAGPSVGRDHAPHLG